jgi:hypothetical protein
VLVLVLAPVHVLGPRARARSRSTSVLVPDLPARARSSWAYLLGWGVVRKYGFRTL